MVQGLALRRIHKLWERATLMTVGNNLCDTERDGVGKAADSGPSLFQPSMASRNVA